MIDSVKPGVLSDNSCVQGGYGKKSGSQPRAMLVGKGEKRIVSIETISNESCVAQYGSVAGSQVAKENVGGEYENEAAPCKCRKFRHAAELNDGWGKPPRRTDRRLKVPR